MDKFLFLTFIKNLSTPIHGVVNYRAYYIKGSKIKDIGIVGVVRKICSKLFKMKIRTS